MIDESRLVEAIRRLDEDDDSAELPEYWAYYLARIGDDWKGVLARAIITEYGRATPDEPSAQR